VLATLLLVGASLATDVTDSLPRVARTLGGPNGPQMVAVWQRADTSQSNPSAVVAAVGPLGTLGGSPGGSPLPQESLTTPNGTFTATSSLSPDADIDEGGNVVVVWVAKPPYDPNTTQGPGSNELYLSYNGGYPFRVSTDQLTTYPTAYGNFQTSSQAASIARVAVSRDGRRIAVGWSTGGDNLYVNSVNATAVFARTLTVGSPGDRSSISIDGLPVLVTPSSATAGSSGYPGYPGGYGGSGPQATINTGPYHFGDIAADKADGSNSGYVVLSYVRQAQSNAYSQGGTSSLTDGVYVKGFDWNLSQTFPVGSPETYVPTVAPGSAYYSFSEIDASHRGSDGSGWFVVGYNISGSLYAARYSATGAALETNSSSRLMPNSSTGWGFSVGARANTSGVAYLLTQETSYPDTYGVSVFHNVFTGASLGSSRFDVTSGGYPAGTTRSFNPNAVLYDDGYRVSVGYNDASSLYVLNP